MSLHKCSGRWITELTVPIKTPCFSSDDEILRVCRSNRGRQRFSCSPSQCQRRGFKDRCLRGRGEGAKPGSITDESRGGVRCNTGWFEKRSREGGRAGRRRTTQRGWGRCGVWRLSGLPCSTASSSPPALQEVPGNSGEMAKCQLSLGRTEQGPGYVKSRSKLFAFHQRKHF